MKNSLIALLFSAVLSLINIEACEATLVVEPALVKTEITQGRATGAFVIKNTGDEEERYRAKSVHFVVTKEGSLKEIPPDEYSLAGWIKFNPKEFILPPKTSRVVRFSVIPQGKVAQKEYWGAIEFVPLQNSTITADDGKGRSFNINIVSVILVPIYGFVDGTQYSGLINQIYVRKEKGKVYLYCDIANTGNGILRLAGNYQIIDAKGEVVEESDLKYLAAFTRQDCLIKSEIKKPLEAGQYRVKLNLKSQDSHSDLALSGETNFYL